MAEYDFKTLSDYEFERLVRDLLQEEFCITLESFTSGKDEGIDLRFSRDQTGSWIIQCKHYASSSFSQLKSQLKKEKAKVSKLIPSRYIIATSSPLTPARKKAILEIFTPYCQTVQDIFGKDDLNNLLEKFPKIEERNFKLWISSTTILNKILHSSIVQESQFELENIKRKTKIYVENDSLFDAVELLKKNHYCLIVGNPGIGKTTLAEMLMMRYVHEGFKIFKVRESVNELFEMLDRNEKQIFYYDDFLGQIVLKTHLAKNEDNRLVSLLKNLPNYPNTRLVLTTREYVLNQAIQKYEPLGNSNWDIARYALSLSSYTIQIRAQIFYNHLYFSGLPREFVQQFAEKENYEAVIYHRNYNPRIIEYMTDQTNAYRYTPQDFVTALTSNLDNPMKVWQFAFQKHLSEPAQHLLLVLISLSSRNVIQDCQEAFDSLHKYRAEKYHKTISPYAFRDALKELDGDLVVTSLDYGHRRIVVYRNPSVRDFVLGHLTEYLEDLKDLLDSAVFYEQIETLGDLIFAKNQTVSHSQVLKNQFLHATNRLFLVTDSNQNNHIETRFLRSLSYWGSDLPTTKTIENTIKRKFTDYLILNLASEAFYQFNWNSLGEIVSLLKNDKSIDIKLDNGLINHILRVFNEKVQNLQDYNNPTEIEKFEPFIEFHHWGHVNEEQLDLITLEFQWFCDSRLDDLLESARDGIDTGQEAFDIRERAQVLGVWQIENDSRIDEIFSLLPEEYDSYDETLKKSKSTDNSDSIDAMFSSLNHYLPVQTSYP